MWLMVATLSLLVASSESNYPTFDITSSTLHIFLPANTRPGNIIYRIKASDQDKDYPLVFGATGSHCQLPTIDPGVKAGTWPCLGAMGEGCGDKKHYSTPRSIKTHPLNELMDVHLTLKTVLCQDFGSYVVRLETLPCNKKYLHCAANMYLNRSVAPRQKYTFRMTVTDTNGDTATKQVTLEVTESTSDIKFVFPYIPGIIRVPENFTVGQELEHVTVRKNPRLSRPALLELWKEENGNFLEKPPEFKLTQQSKKNTTTGYILLDQPLDFELKTMYKLSVYALDMYAVPGEDSRNIAGFDLVVLVEDIQDTPPVWDRIDPITRLPSNITEGSVVMKVTARDGDKGAPRPVKYGLVPEGNPFTTFFNIDQDTGEIHLARPLKELRSISRPNQPILLTVVAEEIVSDRQNLDMTSSTATVALLLDQLQSSAPSFLTSKYIAHIAENSVQGTVLEFEDQYKTQVDLGKHGVFALELENNNGTFEITPSIGNQLVNFKIMVRDDNLLDYEVTKYLLFRIIAKEVNTDNNQGISSTVDVTVYITDVNDNAPVFSHLKYTTRMSENVTMGTEVMRVSATDLDSKEAGVIRYTAILGYLNSSLSLHPHTGVIIVNTDKHGFDREEKAEYHFQVEARDMDGVGNKGTVPLIFQIIDVNDQAPTFIRNPMDIVLAPGAKNFTEQIFVKAIDKDAEPPNNVVRYEIVSGNYNNKFAIDAETGELTVRNVNRQRVLRQTSDSTTELMVRAYDLGIPTLWSTGQVRIYPFESGVSILTFIVPGDKPDRRSVEELLTVMLGSRVTLQQIYPYKDGFQGAARDLAAGYPDNNKSVVIATILPTQYIVETTTIGPERIAAAENRVLFWILVVLLILIALALLSLLCCCLCACCPLYAIGRRKRQIQTSETTQYETQNGEPGHESKGVQAEWSGSNRKEAWSADTYTRRNWQFNRRNNVRRAEPRRVVLVAAPPSENTIINGDVRHQGPPETQPGVNVIYTRDIAQRSTDRIILEDFDGTEYRVLDPSRLSRTVRREEDPDTDSMRRHEYERGSDVGGTHHETRGLENAPRDQMFIREGNAEILRLITRGRAVAEEGPKLNQPDRPYTAQKDNEKQEDDGKEILMKRFMEDQRVSSDKQSSSKEEEPVKVKNIEHVEESKQNESKEQSGDLMKTIMNIPERNLSTGDVNRLTTLQRDLLLTRFLVEEQRRSLAHVAGHDDTQSLPGMTSSMATQTDVNRGTQTDTLYTMRPPRRKVKSDIEDSGESDTEEKQENILNKLKKSRKIVEDKIEATERMRSQSRCEIKTPIMEETESAMEAAGEVLYSGDSLLQSGFGATKSSLLRLQTTRKKLHLDDNLTDEQTVPNINKTQVTNYGFVNSKHKSYSEQNLSFDSFPIGAVKDFNSSFKSLQPTPITKRKYVKLKEPPTEIEINDSIRSKSSLSTSAASSKHTEEESNRRSRRNTVSGDAVSARYRMEERKKSRSLPGRAGEQLAPKTVQSAPLKKDIKKEFEDKRTSGQSRYMEWYKTKREQRERQRAIEREEERIKATRPKRNTIPKQQEEPKLTRKTPEFRSRSRQGESTGTISRTVNSKQEQAQYAPLQRQSQKLVSEQKSKSPSKEIKEETSHTRGLEDDMDSGIAMSHMIPGSQKLKRKNQNLMDKKSVFTIVYDDMQTKQLRLDSASPP